MARIEVAVRIKCDRCGCVFHEETHHGRLILRHGFGDIREASKAVASCYDLCDACSRKVRKFLTDEDEEGGRYA